MSARSDATLKAGRKALDIEAAKGVVEADLVANDAKLVAEEKRAADTARYEALAREHGADLSEEEFNAALRKVGRRGAEG